MINTGGLTLTGSVAVSSPFAVSSGSPYNVAPGQTGTVNVSFIPVTAGTFSNNLIFTSNGGNSTNLVTGQGAFVPVASFTAAPVTGRAPLTVTFTDTSTGTITNRFWNFGNGVTTNTLSTSVTNTYSLAGTNTVTLIVSGPVGVSTSMQPNLISVIVYPPGDVNGDQRVTGADSLLINQVVVGLRSNTHSIFAAAGFANGDVNTNNVVSGADSLLINQVVVGLRAYITTRILPASHSTNQATPVTIYGIGFPTNFVPTVTIGPPVSLTLTNVVVVNREQITATVPPGGGLGTGTVSVVSSPTNAVLSFGRFINQ